MLSAWLYENDPPDYQRIAKYGIGTVYLDPRSQNVVSVAADLRNHNVTPGLYYDPHWNPGLTTLQQAQKISDYVQKGGMIVVGEPVMLDLELLSIPWMTAFVKSYRSYLPSRPTSVTVAPFQAPVLPIQAFLAAGFDCYPQLYYGDMSPADGAAVTLELVRAGYPADRVHPFYDGARLPTDARDGAIFTLERLPA